MNDTTFQGNGSVKYVPVVVNAKLTKPITNADRIRSMTDEELATWLTACLWGEARDVPFLLSCTVDKWLDWLQQPATGNCAPGRSCCYGANMRRNESEKQKIFINLLL